MFQVLTLIRNLEMKRLTTQKRTGQRKERTVSRSNQAKPNMINILQEGKEINQLKILCDETTEVDIALRSQQNNMAAGADQITPEMLKNGDVLTEESAQLQNQNNQANSK